MKLYIILTYDIHHVGGTQTYTWGKSEYLARHGWKVAVYYPGDNTGESEVSYLTRFIKGGMPALFSEPNALTTSSLKYILKQVLKRYDLQPEKYDEVIVESHYDTVALWGELLAEYVHGKHMCFICSEYFDEPRRYRRHLDFYKFKYDRRELYGIHKVSMSRLFNGRYEDIPNEDTYVFRAYSPNLVIQDIPCAEMDSTAKFDWLITYFGRSQKHYFRTIVNDVASFAKNYADKQIRFVFIGDTSEQSKMLQDLFQQIHNVELVELGAMSPVPQIILKKSNVVIAGAGCARWSYIVGTYTIVADAKDTDLSNGVLGYDTFNTLFAEDKGKQSSFYEYLCKVLVSREYDQKERASLFSEMSINDESYDDRYDEHFKLIDQSSRTKAYFNIRSKREYNSYLISLKLIVMSTPGMYPVYMAVKNWVKRIEK